VPAQNSKFISLCLFQIYEFVIISSHVPKHDTQHVYCVVFRGIMKYT